MSKEGRWAIDVKTLSTQEIVSLLGQLRKSEHEGLAENLKRELIKRARDEGGTDEQIIRALTRAVPRGEKLNEVAKEWADVLGITVKEFKRIANVK